jgi:hypothetical protein
MTIAESFLPEFDHEMTVTRKVLERVPEAHGQWKPHEKSYSQSSPGPASSTPRRIFAARRHSPRPRRCSSSSTGTSRPRAAVVRSFFLNHLIHHRGRLTVHLRLQNVPLPPVYGRTADEG